MPEQLWVPPEYLNYPYQTGGAPPDPIPEPPPPPDLAGLFGFRGLGSDESDSGHRPPTAEGGSAGWGSRQIDTTGPMARIGNAMGMGALGPLGAVPGTVAKANNLSYVNQVRRSMGLPELTTGQYLGGLSPIGGNEYGSGSPNTKIGEVGVNDRSYSVTGGGGVVDGRTTITPREAMQRQFWEGQSTATVAGAVRDPQSALENFGRAKSTPLAQGGTPPTPTRKPRRNRREESTADRGRDRDRSPGSGGGAPGSTRSGGGSM